MGAAFWRLRNFCHLRRRSVGRNDVSADRSALCGSFFAGGFGGGERETVVSAGASGAEFAI